MEDIGLAHGLTRFIHLLLFVYWLGGDFGVFYSSRFVQNTSLSREARLTAAKIFINLDMIPRYCLALMLTVGGVLAEFVGVTHEWWELLGIVLLGPVWVALVYLVHAREGTQAGNTLRKIDYWFRWIMVAAIVGHVVYANMTGRLVGSQAWFSAKLVLFAFLIFCGLMIRRHLPLWAEGFRVLVAGNATPESDQKMLDGMGRSLKYVFMIWTGILLEALLGILKPGIG